MKLLKCSLEKGPPKGWRKGYLCSAGGIPEEGAMRLLLQALGKRPCWKNYRHWRNCWLVSAASTGRHCSCLSEASPLGAVHRSCTQTGRSKSFFLFQPLVPPIGRVSQEKLAKQNCCLQSSSPSTTKQSRERVCS